MYCNSFNFVRILGFKSFLASVVGEEPERNLATLPHHRTSAREVCFTLDGRLTHAGNPIKCNLYACVIHLSPRENSIPAEENLPWLTYTRVLFLDPS